MGSGGHDKSEVTKLDFNFDILSIMQYEGVFGITSLNDFYNEVGFGTEKNLTATDKIALNVLYDCQDVKRKMYQDFINEEVDRNYIELMMQLRINPNEASKRYLKVDQALSSVLTLPIQGLPFSTLPPCL